jgi:hypothetical protein
VTMAKLKAYVFVVLSGVVLLAAAIFVALQWGGQSTFSAFGPDITVRTIYLVLGAAAGGVVLHWMLWLMVRGVWILWKLRRRERRAEAHARRPDDEPGESAGS